MIAIAPVQTMPQNIAPFCEEMGQGIADLYGLTNAEEFIDLLKSGMRINLEHPQIRLTGAFRGKDLLALGMSVLKPHAAEITYIHVRDGARDGEIDHQLLRSMVTMLRDDCKAQGILAEYVPFYPSNLAPGFAALGFKSVDREIMQTSAPLQGAAKHATYPLSPERYQDAAQCLAAAYEHHPSRPLHREFHTTADALDYIHRVEAGFMGHTSLDTLRYCQDSKGRLVALVLASELLPGLGFVLQVATYPGFENQGYGASLIHYVARHFETLQLPALALGLSSNNPARHLYTKLGFRSTQPFTSYYWWREDI